MANPEVTRLYFNYGIGTHPSVSPNDIQDLYIDLAAAMSAVNRKQHHQVQKDGSPLAYAVSVTVHSCKSGMKFMTALNNWTTKNAVKKTAIGWKRQLMHGGVKMSDLPTYAKRFRCALEPQAISAGSGRSLALNMQPILADEYTPAFSSYTDSLGDNATYSNTNEIVMVPVGPDGAVVEYKMKLIGDSASGQFGVISEYLKSRRNIRDASDPTLEFPDPDNLLDPLFATAEELSDDIVDAVQDYNTQRPYDEEGSNELTVGCKVIPTVAGIAQQFSFVVPLGLIKIQGPLVTPWNSGGDATYAPMFNFDSWTIDVHAIYEM